MRIKAEKWLALLVAMLTLASCGTEPSLPDETLPPNGTETEEMLSTETEETLETDSEESGEATVEEEKEIPVALQNHKMTLRFDENGEFKILVLGDVQEWANGPSEQSQAAIAKVTEREDPDLVLFAGDNSWGCGMEVFLERYVQRMTGYLEEHEIPWAHVYGNHDPEYAIPKEMQQEIYESFEYCVSQRGPEDITGVGNYVLPIYSSDETKSEPVFTVWGMDTGCYCVDEGLVGMAAVMPTGTFSGYAYMPFSQVDWYFDTSVEIEEYVGHKVPGLLCIHIPLQEYAVVLANRNEASVEFEGNGYGIGAGPINSGMFSAILERGDIKAVVAGHDHGNYFAGKYCGVNLTYSSQISGDGDTKGGRVFIIREDNPEEIETYMSFVHGVDLSTVPRAMIFEADFESAEDYTLTEGLTLQAGVGQEGSQGLVVTGEGTVTLSTPYDLDKVEYVKFWTDVPAGSCLSSLSIDELKTRYTADLTAESISLMAEGSAEWVECGAGERIPEGFRGQVAVKLESFRNAEGTSLTGDAKMLGYSVAAEGSVTLDVIDCDNNR